MRKLIVAILSLSSLMLHAQASTPAQTQVASDGPVQVKRVSTGVIAPKLIYKVDVNADLTGPARLVSNDTTVVVGMVVDKTGKPSDLKILRSADPLLDQSAEVVAQAVRKQMAEAGVSLVRYQASYEGGYWNTTGAAREVLVAGLAPVLEADGCTVLAHGCVGGGNDQLRLLGGRQPGRLLAREHRTGVAGQRRPQLHSADDGLAAGRPGQAGTVRGRV